MVSSRGREGIDSDIPVFRRNKRKLLLNELLDTFEKVQGEKRAHFKEREWFNSRPVSKELL